MVIRLLDKIYSYNEAQELENNRRHLLEIFYLHLGEVLNFIQDFFGNYFDRNEKVPILYLSIAIDEFRAQKKQLQKLLESNRVTVELIRILMDNFEAFCLLKPRSPSYNQLHYQKDLIAELLLDSQLISEKSVKEVLFYFNFNDNDFVAYLIDKLKGFSEAEVSNSEKIAALRYEQKKINQLRSKLNCFLSPNMPSLKEQINTWIEEEIKYLQFEPVFSLPVKTGNEPKDKIQISLSVSKLALLIKLMVIDKVITNRVVAQVLRIVIRTVETAHAENIGFSSFESKYHKTDKGTISAVKEMLFRWIGILNQL